MLNDEEIKKALEEAKAYMSLASAGNPNPPPTKAVNLLFYLVVAVDQEQDKAKQASEALGKVVALNKNLTDALAEWLDKTEWVQQTSTSGELGKHRADIMRDRLLRTNLSLKTAMSELEGWRLMVAPLYATYLNDALPLPSFKEGKEGPHDFTKDVLELILAARQVADVVEATDMVPTSAKSTVATVSKLAIARLKKAVKNFGEKDVPY